MKGSAVDMSTSTESIYKNNLLGREEIQCNYLPPNLSPVMEEDSQLWKPQDEIFLKEQQLKLVEEFGEDSGFRGRLICELWWLHDAGIP